MTHAAAHLAPFFPLHTMLGQASLEGLSAPMWTERPQAGVNHPVWILAHVNGVRREIARNLGAQPGGDDVPAPQFGDDCLAADRYPTSDELLADFATLGAMIATHLESADDEVLGKTYEPPFPDGAQRTVGEALAFLVSHEALHIGQLSLIRRLHGLPGIANIMLEKMAQAQG